MSMKQEIETLEKTTTATARNVARECAENYLAESQVAAAGAAGMMGPVPPIPEERRQEVYLVALRAAAPHGRDEAAARKAADAALGLDEAEAAADAAFR